MIKDGRFLKLFLAILLLPHGVTAFTPQNIVPMSPEKIIDKVFLGQAYPSGAVYFRLSQDSKSLWPQNLSVIAAIFLPSSKHPIPRKNHVFSAKREQIFSDPAMIGNTTKEIYPPNWEKMEDAHDNCGYGKEKRKTAYKYIGNYDFFHTMVDYCHPMRGNAKYRHSEKSTISFNAIGFEPSLGRVKVSRSKNRLRSSSPAELQETKKAKSKSSASNPPCNTEPKYIDSAREVMNIHFVDQKVTAVLSTYTTPGCAGHLSQVFILDLEQGSKRFATRKFIHYQGPM